MKLFGKHFIKKGLPAKLFMIFYVSFSLSRRACSDCKGELRTEKT
jgi:hypothetical protein